MSDKEKIKKYIEFYKESMKGFEPHSDFRRGQITAYNQILQFIDSLPEELGCKKDYRERYKRITQTEQFKKSYCDKSLGKEEPASEDLKQEISKWRNHYIAVLDNNLRLDLRDIEVTADYFAEWQRKKDVEKMMKTLIEGEIVKDIHNQLKVTSEPLNDTFGKFGDRVKIIIVKED